MNQDRRNVLVCALLLALAAVATRPVLEMGINDDWSYAMTARQFARTGHFLYNGWASPILVPQILWSALFVKLLGFSFFALRLSSMVIAVACVPALYYLARECGLKPEFAAFATLSSVLAPVFLPEAVTFMTDVQGFFPFVLCLRAGMRAMKTKSTAACLGWCGAVALTGIWSGSIRQVFFAAPVLALFAIGVLAIFPRALAVGEISTTKRRALGISILAIAAATLGIGLAITRWFSRQPYTIPDNTLAQLRDETVRDVLRTASITLLAYVGTIALFLLPLLAAYFVASTRILSRKIWIPALLATGAIGGLLLRDPEWRIPWLGNVVTDEGIFSAAAVALGNRPPTLTPPIEIVLSMLVFVCAAATVLVFAKLWRKRKEASGADGRVILEFLVITLPFAAGTLALIALRSNFITVFDRYLIPILPICSIPLLWIYQTRVRTRMSFAGWSLVAIFGLYAVAGTHDLFADGRARLQAIQEVEAERVPKTEILGGFEYDGWTQIETRGFVNNSDLPDSHHFTTCSGPEILNTWLRDLLPDIQPRYYIAFAPVKELVEAPFPPVRYSAWLPPHHREALIQMQADGSISACH